MVLRVLVCAMLSLALAGPAAAQVPIRVVDADGQPIPAVQIDVYGRGELIATESTSGPAYVVAGGSGDIHGRDHTPLSTDERITREGYAWPPLVIDGTTGGRELAWKYPELDRSGAHHFASAVFGALHDFAVATASERETTLVFCANGEGTGATIDGTITLVPGERFVAAAWRFDTEEPDEGAGGSVWFTSLVNLRASRPHLVASRGYFYRHDGTEPPYPELGRTYSRWGHTEARWHLLPTSDQPCNTGISYRSPRPQATDSVAVRFAACVAESWGR